MSVQVLHVIDHLGYGGAPLVVQQLMDRLDHQRIEPLVCSLRANPRPISVSTEVVTLDCPRYSLACLSHLRRLCQERGIEVVHAHLQKSIVSCLLAITDRPVFIHEHGAIFRQGTGAIYRALLRWLGKRAAFALANSQATLKALQAQAGFDTERTVLLENFVDVHRFDPVLYDGVQTRARLGVKPEDFVVGFVGRLDPCKGADLLIEAAALALSKGKKWHWIIVGYGPQEKALKAAASRYALRGCVHFTGLSENPAEWMVAFDAAVVPSRREAFGLATVEMMRMKIPVVVSPVGGLADLIEHRQNGWRLPALSAESIVEALHILYQDTGLRQQMIEQAWRLTQSFTGEAQIETLTQLYESCQKGRQP